MSSPITEFSHSGGKDVPIESGSDIEKYPIDDEKKALEVEEVEFDNPNHIKAVEEMEDRLAKDIASDSEYLVKDGHDIAIKVLSTHDDPTLQALTFRYFFLGLGFSAFGSVLAQIYYFKPQTLTVSQLFLLVMTYWGGTLMHYCLPSKGIFRWLNPGPFNIKEHVGIIIMSSTAASSATAIQVISVQNLFYDNRMNGAIAIFLLIGSQLLGYSFAGLLQEALVFPSSAFWPATISSANLFQALHYDNMLTSKRVRLFWMVFGVVFVWEIFPQWIFPWLTGISIFCLADNGKSSTFRNIFGGANNNEGMALMSWCLDWNLIGSNCLYWPIWTQVNIDIGICLTYIMMAAIYYGNVWKAKTFPFMSQALFDQFGNEYNQTAILTDNKFDPVKYQEVGPAYFSATNALYLVTSNLSMGAIVMHIGLWCWPQVKPFVVSLNPFNKEKIIVHDEHYAKMQAYKAIPRWWYVCLGLGAYAIAVATCYTGHSGLPWWTLTILIIISFFFFICFATLAATLGFYEFSSSGQGFYQMITAYILPGKPVANMYGALYGQNPMIMGIALLQDLKLGQYVKLAPRVTFLSQVLGTVVGAVLNYVMMITIINNNRDALLSISGTRLWSGQNAQSYNSNAISWGALGPKMFGGNSTYKMVPIALAIGFFLPLPFYFAHKLWPGWNFDKFSVPVIMQYSCYLSVGINTSVNPSMAIGVFSQWYMRTRRPRLFTKYNYIVSAALDGGTQVISFILNFAVFGASGTAHAFPIWWGNPDTVSVDHCKLAPN